MNILIEIINYLKKKKKQLDPIPRLILIPGLGLIGIGKNKSSANIAADIGQAWIETALSASSYGNFEPIGEKDTFDLEYWSLEQAKLSKNKRQNLEGYVVVITGAGGVIGKNIVNEFKNNGAEIVGIDLKKKEVQLMAESCGGSALGIDCDITKNDQIEEAFKEIIKGFGGIDILISNAGAAWEGSIASMDESIFRKKYGLKSFCSLLCFKKSNRNIPLPRLFRG